MNIVIIGATGTIGSAVANAFGEEHHVIRVGLTNGDYQMDINDEASIKQCLALIKTDHGSIQALISTTGKAAFNEFSKLSSEDWQLGISSKMMGQINLVRFAKDYLAHGAAITLTTGVLNDEPIAIGVSAATMNGAINSFVEAVAPVLENNMRINCVSPTVLEESMHIYEKFFPGFVPVAAKKVAQAYLRSTLGIANGQIMRVS
ncbi:MAG: short chain dehydrogenase [Oceanospirillaceae bacterium]